jgi:uncharacterized protein YajQ (UPF0234 family)
MPSFDVVSKVDWSELDNALNQAEREVGQRFDFKGTETSLEKQEQSVVVRSATEERAKAAIDVLEQKLVRRKVSLKHLEQKDPEPGPKGSVRVVILVKEGIETEKARQIVKLLKDSKLKVQGSIQDQSVRVSGKKKDDLQDAIRLLRGEDLGIELQFVNFRD